MAVPIQRNICFSAHAKFLSDPNPRWEWRDLTPPTRNVACAGGGQGEHLPRLISLGRVRPDRPKALATPLEYVLRVKLIIKIFVGSVNRAASSMGWAAGPLHGGCCSPSSNTTAGSRTCPSCGCPWASVRKKLFSHGSRARP